jgi:hypothetical protein
MAANIALVGIPLEDLYFWGDSYLLSTYVPHITDRLRKEIIEGTAGLGIKVRDIGEVFMGPDYHPPFSTDRYIDIPECYHDRFPKRNMNLLSEARDFVLNRSRYFDLLVAVGPSHLGAITLYDNFEAASRFDYHGDYRNMSYNILDINFACYMNWVEHNLIFTDVTNYCVTSKSDYEVFGRRAEGISDNRYLDAKVLDIDVDCVDRSYNIQDCYTQLEGPPGVSPDDIVRIASESRCERLGFFEYRLNHDHSEGLGLKMIVDSIVGWSHHNGSK